MKNVLILGLSASLLLASQGLQSPHFARKDGLGEIYATFVDYNGNELYEESIAVGSAPVFRAANPSRPSDDVYDYTFVGWDKALGPITEDTVYRAQYSTNEKTFTATFLNIDGSFLYKTAVEPGKAPVYVGETPTYSTIEGVSYRFLGWDKQPSPIQKNTTYVATYDRSDSRNRCRFYDGYGNLVMTLYVKAGGNIDSYSVPTSDKEASGAYGTRYLRFLNWDQSLENIRSNTDFHPVYCTYEEAIYNVDINREEGYAVFNGFRDLGTLTDVALPTTYAGYPVTHLGSLSGLPSSIRTLAIPEGYETISSNYYGMNSSTLTKVILPSSLQRIESQAFYGYSNLTTIDFSQVKALEYIGYSAFSGTKISSLNLPEKVGGIEEGTFEGCNIYNNRLTSNGVTYIRVSSAKTIAVRIPNMDNVFSDGSTGLRSDCIGIAFSSSDMQTHFSGSDLTLPSKCAFISGNFFDYVFGYYGDSGKTISLPACFYSCSYSSGYHFSRINYAGDLKGYCQITGYLHASELYIGGEQVTSIAIPEGITRIPDERFNGLSSLTSVTFPSTLKEIGSNAFNGTGITTVTLPSGLTNLGYHAFSDCYSLTRVSFPSDCSKLQLGGGIFWDCSSLQSVSLGRGIKTLPYETFSYCNKLASCPLPSSLERIESRVFQGTSSLKQTNLPSGLKEIGAKAFLDSGVTRFDVPSSVTSVEASAFPDGAIVNYMGGLDQILQNDINPGYQGADSYYYAQCSYSLYLNGSEAKTLVLPAKVTTLRDGVFANYANIERVDIQGPLTSIGKRAFYKCSALESIVLPETIVNFTGDAFIGCSNLESLSIVNNPNFKTIDGDVYDDSETCLLFVAPAKSGEYVVRDGVITINDGAFALVTGITKLTLPSSVRVIGQEILTQSKLQEVNLNEGLTYIGSRAFSGDMVYNEIEELTLPSTLRYVSNAFANSHIQKLILAPGFGQGLNSMGTLTDNSIGEIHYSDSFAHLMGLRFYQNPNNYGDRSFLDKAQKLYCNETLFEVADAEALERVRSASFNSSSYLRNTYGDTYVDTFSSSSIRSLEARAFNNMSFSTMSFSKLEYMDSEAISNGYNLSSLSFVGSSIREIPSRALASCTGIQKLAFNEGLRTIGENIFSDYGYNYDRAIHIVVPSTLEEVYDTAFGSAYYDWMTSTYKKTTVHIYLPQNNADAVREAVSNAANQVNLEFHVYGSYAVDDLGLPVINAGA